MLALRDFFMTKSFLSLDTETTSTDAIDAELVGLSFSVKENEAYYVPVPAERKEAEKIVNIFKPVCECASILKIGQNIKYDLEVLANYGVELAGEMFDTMIAHYLLQPELRHNMDYMAEVYLGYKTIHIDELIGPKGKGQLSMRDLKPEQVYEYAAEDADVTLKLKNILEPQLKEVGAWQLFTEVEMPLVRVLAAMEMNGVRLDTASLKETSQILTQRMNDIEQEIYRLAGEEFNIASPKQVGEILFGKMKIVEKPKKTKTGQYVTSEEVLQQLRGKSEIVGKILEHRGLKKLLGTYVDALPKLVNPRTGHIHTRPPAGSRRQTPTYKTFPCAARTARKSARLSCPRRAACSSQPITRRLSCASWRTSAATKTCRKPSARATTSTPPRQRKSTTRRWTA